MTTDPTLGLPSDATVAEHIAEQERRREAHNERIERIVQAFTKLSYSEAREGEDMADAIRAHYHNELRVPYYVELSLDDLEAISLRIAELNQMVMQGRLTSDDAERAMRAAEREATEHPQGSQTGRLSVAQPNLSNVKPYKAPDSPL